MKKSFLTGLIILLPAVVTFFLLTLVLDIFTSPFLELVSKFLSNHKNLIPIFNSPVFVAILGKIIIIIFFTIAIILLGMLGQWFLFKAILHGANAILMKIPFFKSIYHTAKDLISSVFSIDERKAFVHPLMVPFPSEKSYSVSFLSGTVPPECQSKINKKLVSVFVPTAPHPISGYLIFVSEDEIDNINMTNEQAVKFTVSCGVITPETQKEINNEKSTT